MFNDGFINSIGVDMLAVTRGGVFATVQEERKNQHFNFNVDILKETK